MCSIEKIPNIKRELVYMIDPLLINPKLEGYIRFKKMKFPKLNIYKMENKNEFFR